eukprot:jgi/Undpi1/11733/HiC_scaffold_37.g14028.m1
MSFAQPFADYVILDRVGAGAMGTVFKARQKRLDRIVALKVLRPSLARNKRYVDRLRREAHIVAQFNHPHIVTGYDLGEEGGYHFFVMEYVEGKALKDLLHEWGSFPEDQVLEVAIQCASALNHAFEKGVIHRDIKPGNILIDDETGIAKLTDLGLAKAQGDMTLTREGATVGTPQYISPEQARNPQTVDVRSDLYSLGATLYHMATGQPPFRGESMAEVITKVLNERARSAHEINPELSDGLSLVIRKLLAKDVELRYQNPGELLADLDRVQRQETPEVDRRRLEQGERLGRAPRWVRPALQSLAGAVLIGSAMGAGALIWGGNGSSGASVEIVGRQLDAARARGPQAYLRRLESYRAGGRVELQEEIRRRYDEFIETMQATLVREVGTVTAGRLERLAADPRLWGAAPAQVAAAVRRDVGLPLPLDELPPEVSREPLVELELRAQTAVAVARQRFEADLADYLVRADGVVNPILERWEFDAAERQVRVQIQGFLGQGEWPGRAALPATVLGIVDDKLRAFEQKWLDRIERTEGQAEQALRTDVDSRAAALIARLTQVEAGPAVLDELPDLRRHLARKHPGRSAFRRSLRDPWRHVDLQLEQLAFKARQQIAAVRRAEFDDRLALSYGTLVFVGDVVQARRLLNGFEPSPELEDLHSQHLGGLRAAEQVASEVLSELSRSARATAVRRRVGGERPVDVLVVPSTGRSGLAFELLDSLSRQPIRLVDVHFSDLHDAAQRRRSDLLQGLPPDERDRGLLLWLCVGDEFDRVPELVANDVFVQRHAWPRIRRVREDRDRFGGEDVTLRLAGLQLLRDRASGLVAEPGRALSVLEDLLGGIVDVEREFALDERPELAERVGILRRWAIDEKARLLVLRDLSSALEERSPGSRGRVMVMPDMRQSIAFAGESGVGQSTVWRTRGGGAVFKGRRVLFAQLESNALRVPDVLKESGEVTVEWEVEFPQAADETSAPLWFFRARGAILAVTFFGADQGLRAGLVDELRPKSVQRVLAEPVAAHLSGFARATAVPRIVPGARHVLALRIEYSDRGDQMRVQALRDGLPITPVVEMARKAPEDVSVLPLAPLLVHELRVRRSPK